jgi:hypothetical protein
MAVAIIIFMVAAAQLVATTIELKDLDRIRTSQIQQNYELILDLYTRVGIAPPNKTKRVMIPKD